MALTTHQRFHLDAMLAEIADNKTDARMMARLASNRRESEATYSLFLDRIKRRVDDFKRSGVFPPGLDCPCRIHDHIEKIMEGITNG